MILQPRCWVPYSTFVLSCSSWTCVVNPLGSPSSCFADIIRLHRFVWISSRLWFCSRSSQSLQGFGASLLVTWSHPTFVRYKATYPLFVASYLCSVNLLSWRSSNPRVDSYRYLSQVKLCLYGVHKWRSTESLEKCRFRQHVFQPIPWRMEFHLEWTSSESFMVIEYWLSMCLASIVYGFATHTMYSNLL
jgi:hypothetical protein